MQESGRLDEVSADLKIQGSFWHLIALYIVLKSVELHRQSIAASPGHAKKHYDYGVALKASGILEEATVAYEKSIELSKSLRLQNAGEATKIASEAYNNLGSILQVHYAIMLIYVLFC